MNKDCYYNKTMNFLLKSTIRGLLVETPEVARFFPPLFKVHSCQVRLFAIPRRVLPS